MSKRRLLRWSLILAILAAFAVWLEPTRVVWGWLRGEAFYQGRPTSWWRQELTHWNTQEVWRRSSLEWCASQRHLEIVFVRSPTRFDEVMGWIREKIFRAAPAEPFRTPVILDYDVAAEAVLTDLSKDGSQEIRSFAKLGLERIRAVRASIDSNLDDGKESP